MLNSFMTNNQSYLEKSDEENEDKANKVDVGKVPWAQPPKLKSQIHKQNIKTTTTNEINES